KKPCRLVILHIEMCSWIPLFESGLGHEGLSVSLFQSPLKLHSADAIDCRKMNKQLFEAFSSMTSIGTPDFAAPSSIGESCSRSQAVQLSQMTGVLSAEAQPRYDTRSRVVTWNRDTQSDSCHQTPESVYQWPAETGAGSPQTRTYAYDFQHA
ncbi:unnamed protein product, partial [Pleuronectes platessa]